MNSFLSEVNETEMDSVIRIMLSCGSLSHMALKEGNWIAAGFLTCFDEASLC